MQKGLIWSEKNRIPAFEVDVRGRVRIRALCNYMMEAASNHTFARGTGIERMLSHNITWVISRFHIKINLYPNLGDIVSFETWPSKLDGKFAIREFRVTDKNKKVLAIATSSWAVLDIKSRKLLYIPEFITNSFSVNEERIFNDKFERLAELKRCSLEKKFKVRFSDLDQNQHVNYIIYIDWITETVPDEILRDYVLAELEISYRSECRYGDEVISKSERTKEIGNCIFIHRLKNIKNNTELVRAKTIWIKIENRNDIIP